MLEGIISENKPIATIKTAWKDNAQNLSVLVDTGFTGFLKVSRATATELGLETTHTELVILGNDSVAEMGAALATVSVDGGQEVVPVLISPGDPVIGVGLLKKFQCLLNADFRTEAFTIQRC